VNRNLGVRHPVHPSVASLGRATQEAISPLDKAMMSVSAPLRVSAVANMLRSTAFDEIDLSKVCAELFE
jgi:hypothetical protein